MNNKDELMELVNKYLKDLSPEELAEIPCALISSDNELKEYEVILCTGHKTMIDNTKNWSIPELI